MKQEIKKRISQIQKGIVPEGYKKTVVGIVPEEWEETTLSELFTFKNGLNKEKEAFGKGTPIINYTDVWKKRGIRAATVEGKVELSEKEIENYNVQKGDVFFTRTSETRDEIGLSSVLLDDIDNAVFSGFVLRARPINDRVETRYHQYCYSSPLMRHEIIRKSSITTRALTSGVSLGQVAINLPSKHEQKRIADILEKWDKAIELQEQLIEKLTITKQSLMQKLFPRNENDVPELRFIGSSEAWKTRKLVDVSNRFDNMRKPVSAELRISGSTPYYGANGIQDYVEGFTHNGEFILIAEDGAADIKNYPITYTKGKIWVNNHAHVIQANSTETDNEFLSYALNHVNFEPVLVGGDRAKLKAESLMKIKVWMPTLSEQLKIKNVLSEVNLIIQQNQKKIELLKQQQKSMQQLLLTGIVRV